MDVEVVPEPPRAKWAPSEQRGARHSSGGFGGPPIHPLSALFLVVVDNLWLLPEFFVVDWIITIPLCFIAVFIPAFAIQKVMKRQGFLQAFGYALLLAIIAAVPTSLLGTPVGAALLAWFGISKLWGGNRDGAVS